MAFTVTCLDSEGTQVGVTCDIRPDECPKCHRHVVANRVMGYLNRALRRTKPDEELQVVHRCANAECLAAFVAYYRMKPDNSTYVLVKSAPRTIANVYFHEKIAQISPDFVRIYNEANEAEQGGLTLVSGPGYRKALEFLLKDYLIKQVIAENNALDAVTKDTSVKAITSAPLATCIREYIDDQRIKSIATRAVWLGNDHVHYYQKWVDKDLFDLKKLIDLTQNWVLLVTLSAEVMKDMSKPM